MLQFDWVMGALGGLIIGSAGALFLLANGRIMGASGLIGGLVDGSGRDNWKERAAFVGGMFLAPAVLALLIGGAESHATSNLWVLVTAGLLVGIGTRFANGCTSGHGVCGISRLSVRGIVATVFYLIGGGISVLLFRHILGVI